MSAILPIPAQAGIQVRDVAREQDTGCIWTPAFAGVDVRTLIDAR
jgi:hypothetical protein